MRRLLPALVVVALASFPALLAAQDAPPDQWFSADQLDNLVAPIALYPDPLLAQVFVAATFPDQTDEAARFVRDDSNPDDIDAQAWDVSVKAVGHYPEVLDMMADKLDWTTALGQAWVTQSTDVMTAVQRLRAQAQAAGNLVSNPEMQVSESDGEIEIWPAQPEYIYVPEYDPAVIFFARASLYFPFRFAIGAWLNYDCDWRGNRVYYHGWEGGRGWVERSRRFVHITNVYVNNNYRNVVINRTIVQRNVNFNSMNRYNDIHRQTTFARVRGANPPPPRNPPPPPRDSSVTIHNKIIDRNINVNDTRIEMHRGHLPQTSEQVHLPTTPAFTPSHGVFDTHQVSQRGQVSRAHLSPPRPPSPPPPPKGGPKDRR
jgi:hypothetical protein